MARTADAGLKSMCNLLYRRRVAHGHEMTIEFPKQKGSRLSQELGVQKIH